ncbi:MAG: N-6 DNA methylase, partial [Desulfovibrionaceae bacterium]|nr:N-6 DNA methylase [Desulfovibrionaceae bacterium]
MTRTKFKNDAGVNTSVIAKKVKKESFSMKSPAPMTPALHGGTDGTAIHPDDRNNRSPEMTHYGISDATRRNWKKLNTSANGRLAARANKRKSDRRVLPLEYVSNKNNIARIEAILDYIDDHSLDIMSVMLTFGTGLLKKAGILRERHVALTLDEYKDTGITEDLVSAELPDDEFDILGLLYQSYLLEGMKNITGSYYTPQKIARSMVQDLNFSNGQTFLDPCCGSGAFLLAVSAKNPEQIYGIDNDKTAVLIAKINMLLKYKDTAFVPQIYCSDYLSAQSPVQNNDIYERKFNYIATNPPWGAMNKNYAFISGITSKESFSYFFVKSFNQLDKDGTIKFLFPEAVLNVKNHK